MDSEQIASILQAHGVEVTRGLEGADVAIINTCGFIQTAKEESIGTILDVAARKREDGRPKRSCIPLGAGIGPPTLTPPCTLTVG